MPARATRRRAPGRAPRRALLSAALGALALAATPGAAHAQSAATPAAHASVVAPATPVTPATAPASASSTSLAAPVLRDPVVTAQAHFTSTTAASVWGTVTDAMGQPATGVQVNVSVDAHSPKPVIAAATADASGRFRTTLTVPATLPMGDNTVSVWFTDDYGQQGNTTAILRKSSTAPTRLVASLRVTRVVKDGSVVVSGTLTTTKGVPLANEQVVVGDPDVLDMADQFLTDAAGHFSGWHRVSSGIGKTTIPVTFLGSGQGAPSRATLSLVVVAGAASPRTLPPLPTPTATSTAIDLGPGDPQPSTPTTIPRSTARPTPVPTLPTTPLRTTPHLVLAILGACALLTSLVMLGRALGAVPRREPRPDSFIDG